MRASRPMLAALLTLYAGAASAHAFLKTATPAVGSTVPQGPSQVIITFTEGVEPRFTTITVVDAAGARVDTGALQEVNGDNQRLAIGLKPLRPGTYKVTWHATSVDTHKTEGSYSFTVGQ